MANFNTAWSFDSWGYLLKNKNATDKALRNHWTMDVELHPNPRARAILRQHRVFTTASGARLSETGLKPAGIATTAPHETRKKA